MNCPDCRHDNDAQRGYCGACGAALARFCVRCGFRNGAQDRYCGGCGASLAEVAAPGPVAAAPGPVPRSTPAPAGAVDELLAAAEEAVRDDAGEGDIRVDQNDIDSLFGD